MEHANLLKVDQNTFADMIVGSVNHPAIILVQCNDARPIIQAALLASEKIKTHEVFYQPNSFFPDKLIVDEFTTEDYWRQSFEAFCNYFDVYKNTLIIRINKRLFNYSKNREELKVVDYPDNLKMILIVENLNFWDLNSQREMVRLPEQNPNIVLIGQLRSNFAFASKHIDVGVASRASHVSLEC